MTSTPCQSAALDRVAAFLAIIVETILTILHELGVCCREAPLLRHKAGFLPPPASALRILARKRSPEFERAVTMDIELSIGASWVTKSPRQRILKGS